MNYQENNSITQFTDKYTQTNFISRRLLANFYKQLTSLIAQTQVDSILEVGCGAGYSTAEIKKSLPHIKLEASDIDPALVAMTKEKNPTVICQTESIYDLKRADNSFAMVIALETMEHLEQPTQALVQLQRVAEKYVIISVPNEPLWRILNLCRLKYIKDWGNTPGHINHWSKSSLVKLLSQYFDVISIRQPLPWTMILAKTKK